MSIPGCTVIRKAVYIYIASQWVCNLLLAIAIMFAELAMSVILISHA